MTVVVATDEGKWSNSMLLYDVSWFRTKKNVYTSFNACTITFVLHESPRACYIDAGNLKQKYL